MLCVVLFFVCLGVRGGFTNRRRSFGLCKLSDKVPTCVLGGHVNEELQLVIPLPLASQCYCGIKPSSMGPGGM